MNNEPHPKAEAVTVDRKRREFVARLSSAAAVPVVTALSLTWTQEARAYE